MTPAVSVICAVLNEGDNIDELVERLRMQTFTDWEAIFADGGSNDGTPAMLRAASTLHPEIRILDNPAKIQSAGLNLALDQARGEWIVRLDGHSFVGSDYIERVVGLLKQRDAGVAGGRMVPRPATGTIGVGIAIANAAKWGAGPAGFHHGGEPHRTDTVYLGAFPRSLLQQVGGWAEDLVTNEDYELNYRIRSGGREIWLDPGIEVEYTPRSSLGAVGRQYFRYGVGKAMMLARHPRSIRLRQLLPATGVPVLAAVLLFGGSPVAVLFLAGHLIATVGLGIRSAWGQRRMPGAVAGVAAFLMHWAWSIGFWRGLLLPRTWRASGRRQLAERTHSATALAGKEAAR